MDPFPGIHECAETPDRSRSGVTPLIPGVHTLKRSLTDSILALIDGAAVPTPPSRTTSTALVYSAFLACQNWSNDKDATLPETFNFPTQNLPNRYFLPDFLNSVTSVSQTSGPEANKPLTVSFTTTPLPETQLDSDRPAGRSSWMTPTYYSSRPEFSMFSTTTNSRFAPTPRPVGRAVDLCALAFLAALLVPTVSSARTIYVDNLRGRDICQGLVANPIDRTTGPVRTLERAAQLARQSDTIHLANTGHPYHGDLRLFGRQHSGISTLPFRVVGNGATVSGAKRIPMASWRSIDGLWQMAPRRKGRFLLLKDGKPLPRQSLKRNGPAPQLESIPVGHWGVWRGKIYYRTTELLDTVPSQHSIAGGDCGISLFAVRHVSIENLVVQHWRLDGISAPGLCRDVVLKNVICRENGRAGLVVSGTSQIRAETIELTGNIEHSLLIENLGLADVVDAKFSKPPTLAP